MRTVTAGSSTRTDTPWSARRPRAASAWRRALAASAWLAAALAVGHDARAQSPAVGPAAHRLPEYPAAASTAATWPASLQREAADRLQDKLEAIVRFGAIPRLETMRTPVHERTSGRT